MIFRLFMAFYRYIQRKRSPINFARSQGVSIGENCRLLGNIEFGTEPYLISIGNHVTVTSGVKFITHDGGVWVFREKQPTIDVIAPITIGNNVFIGSGVILMPGVTIGDNCVIGAGAVVTKNIPSNCVAAGVPAKPIKSIDEYYSQLKEKKISIKLLNSSEKKRILIDMFKIRLKE